MKYLVKTPWLLRKIYPDCIWRIPGEANILYLTFDDGPHPEATPFVLAELKKYNAKATFFCIGKNVKLYPHIFEDIIAQGHATGNHTHHHLNGWKTDDEDYLADIILADQYIKSSLFRPPYGRIKRLQIKKLIGSRADTKIIMWSVLSGDFDPDITERKCATNVINNAQAGSIVVFHDSAKAFLNIRYALPLVLEHFSKLGYVFQALKP